MGEHVKVKDDDSLLEEWPTAGTSMQSTEESLHDSDSTLLENWPTKLGVISNIDHILLKHAVKEANNNNKSSVERDELDITLRAYGLRSSRNRSMENNKHRRARVTEDSATTDTATTSITSANDVLEEWPTRSRSTDSKKDSDSDLVRRNSLDFECVNQSLRALKIRSSHDDDDVNHKNDVRTNRKHEIVLKGDRISPSRSNSGKLSSYNQNDTAPRLIPNVMLQL